MNKLKTKEEQKIEEDAKETSRKTQEKDKAGQSLQMEEDVNKNSKDEKVIFKKSGPKFYKTRSVEKINKDSSNMEIEKVDISSTDCDTSLGYRLSRYQTIEIDDNSDASPPGKINIISSGGGTRKRERSGSVSDGSWTTGAYIGKRKAILKYNEAKEEALRLDREKFIREYDEKELFKKAKINLEKIKEQMEEMTNEELEDKVKQNLNEMIRIAKTFSNLKGTYQKSLKIAAASSMGIMEVFQDRASLSKEEAQMEEVKLLRKEVKKLKLRLEEEVENERRKALQSAGEAEAYRAELFAMRKERIEKSEKTPSPKEKIGKMSKKL